MIEQYARVLEVRGDSLLVATERQSGCNSCDVKGSCGTSLIGRLFPQRPQQQLSLPIGDLSSLPGPGDRVIIGIDEGYLHSSTLLLYAVPLGGLLGGAILGSWLGGQPGSPLSSEPMSILFCLLGLSLALVYTRGRASARTRAIDGAVRLLRVEPRSVAVPLAGDLLGMTEKDQ